MEENVRNIYQKLQDIRKYISEQDIQKSGYNEYQKYAYYQLGDFMPYVIEACHKYGTTPIFNMDKDCAYLKVFDNDIITSKIDFEMPLANMVMQGANGMQNIGGMMTYSRRYLYMAAFEIEESDNFNAMEDAEQQEKDEFAEVANMLIDDSKVKTIVKGLAEINIPEERVCNKYNVSSIKEITEGQYQSVINDIEVTKEKIEEKQKAGKKGAK